MKKFWAHVQIRREDFTGPQVTATADFISKSLQIIDFYKFTKVIIYRRVQRLFPSQSHSTVRIRSNCWPDSFFVII